MSSSEIQQAHTPVSQGGEKRLGFFSRIILFIKQVFAELKKVTTPTRKELWNYFLVVLAFVIIMMIFVWLIDMLFGILTVFTFGTTA